MIDNNIFDIDPFQTSSGRGSHGTWTSPGQDAIYSQSSPNLSVSVLRNTFRNVYADSNVDSSAPPANWLWQDNILQADPNSVGGSDPTSRGVGLARRSAGTRLQQLDSDPASSTYGQVLNGGQTVSGGVPTAGKWLYGDYVREGTPSAAQPFAGYFRATTGTGQALGTDWWPVPLAVKGALSWGPFSVVPNGTFAAAVVTSSNFYASPTAAVPITVTIPAPPSGGTQATAHVASMQGVGNSNDFSNHGAGYTAGTAYPIVSADGVTVGTVTPNSSGGFYLGNCSFNWAVLNQSSIPSGPFTVEGGSTSAVFPAFNLEVLTVAFDAAGAGYLSNQPLTFSGTNSVGAATGTAVLGGTIWTAQPIALDPAGKVTVQKDASGEVVISSGGTRLFSIDASGNVVAKGTITQNGSP